MAKKSKSTSAPAAPTSRPQKRTYVSQADIPKRSLRDALTLAQSITDNFANAPTSPPQIAMALNISPTSSAWRELSGSATAYGLTKGGYNADKITLEPLGRRITAPTIEGDDIKARAEAALKPTVFSQFFEKYNRNKFPPDPIARNVLQQEFGVPSDRAAEVLGILRDNGTYVGFIHETKTGPFVSIEDLKPAPVTLPSAPQDEPLCESSSVMEGTTKAIVGTESTKEPQLPTGPKTPSQFRVFITHGKNMDIVEQVKDVLDLYDIEYEVAVEEETAAIPVPQKVLTAMRRCQAGVMIVSADEKQTDSQAFSINNNVLIEIGAAFVLYDQKVVLLWDKRLKVPSNLQGLYRCEFEGNQLTFSVGTKLAKAVKGFRTDRSIG